MKVYFVAVLYLLSLTTASGLILDKVDDDNGVCKFIEQRQCVEENTKFLCPHKCSSVTTRTITLGCNPACTKHYAPICGTNGKTYANRCTLNYAQCIDPDENIKVNHKGRCRPKGDNGLTANGQRRASSSLPEGDSEYYATERGSLYSLDYKIFIIKRGLGPISPFHDIPLFANEADKIFNMVVEIPRWTNAKMEINKWDELNCITQDTKDDMVRFVSNCFPYKGYIWNYGALPQTWEDPNHIDENSNTKGDNDPIDVCEIGYRVAKRGEILQVKVLGVLGLIDEGETDWKLIVIDTNDPLASQLNDIEDVEEHMPGFLSATVDWYRIYKVPAGSPENVFAFDGVVQDRKFAHEVILETHKYWKDLIEGRSESGDIYTNSVTVANAKNKMTAAEAQALLDAAPQLGKPLPLEPEIDMWYYCRK